MKKLIVLLALASCLASASQAADKWTVMGLGGAGGMYTPTLSPFDAKMMFISCDMSGSYRSVDGGRTWELIHYKQLRSSRECRPAFLDKDTALWVNGELLRISRDRGATWTPVANCPAKGITHIVVASSKPAQVVVGSDSGVWAASFGADGRFGDWKPLGRSACGGLAAAADSAYFAAEGKVMHYMAGSGKDPVALATSPGGKIIALAAADPTRGKRSETHPDILAAIVEGSGTFWSTDLGKTWAKSQPWANQKDILMPAGQGQVAYATEEHREVWRTADGGKSWAPIFHMTGAGRNVDVAWTQTFLHWSYTIGHLGIGIDPSNPEVVLMTSEGDFYRSNDGGRRWFQCQNDPIGVKPGDPGFRLRTIGLEVTSLWGYYFDPYDANRAYICYTDVGFSRTADKGATWIWSAEGCPWSNTFYEIAFDPRVKGRVYAATSNRHDIPHWQHLDANQPQHAGGVCVSDDFAASWKVLGRGQPKLPCTSVAADPKSPQGRTVLYAAFYEGGVYKSSDGGATWEKKSNGLGNPGNMHCLRLRFSADGTKLYCLITAIRNGSNFPVAGGLWVTTDGGDSWKDASASAKFYRATDFALDPKNPNTIYVNASSYPGHSVGGIYKTTDGGATWTRLVGDDDFAKWCNPTFYEGSTITIHPDDSNLLYACGDGHGLWYSTDAGKTWQPFESFPFGGPQNVAFEPSNHKVIVVTTFGGGAWRGPYLPGK